MDLRVLLVHGQQVDHIRLLAMDLLQFLIELPALGIASDWLAVLRGGVAVAAIGAPVAADDEFFALLLASLIRLLLGLWFLGILIATLSESLQFLELLSCLFDFVLLLALEG